MITLSSPEYEFDYFLNLEGLGSRYYLAQLNNSLGIFKSKIPSIENAEELNLSPGYHIPF